MAKRQFIPNQIFIGLPWQLGAKYDRVIAKLHAKYPLYFTIVGRRDAQDAVNLFDVIKERIETSSYGIFDATGGNANVSLEFGYAEGIEVPRMITLSSHRSAQKHTKATPIISDLVGMRRAQYTNEEKLFSVLERFCKDHDYTQRFEKALAKMGRGINRGEKKAARAASLKAVRALDAKSKIRRAELVQHLEAKGYETDEVEWVLKQLHNTKVIRVTVGKYSEVSLV
ncbi:MULTISPECIES: hypothetical protein [unclassified Bradyrhizobium]|uniref:hypothetical protein n=1 Tax=unclassified Bradyrhizobium TaxID=2631580 RepID=UPI0028E618DB|nr:MULTISPECIES: hypothetical protein [unclassified Bradyrhizobium]